uniref:MarR family winged helix-turn-helix transcriptional regulator n=1 Tax=Roseivirga sp. TaxID=1964215 RepID=UPI004048DCB6
MNIDEQLKTAKFQNQKHRLRMNMLYTSYWLAENISNFLKPYGITQQQFNLLRILRGQFPEPISTKQLRERMIISNSDTSRLIDRLCEKGLVWKRPCEHDARLIQAFIHEKGQALLAEIDKNIGKLDDVMCNITEEEALTLNKLLNKMRFYSKEQVI